MQIILKAIAGVIGSAAMLISVVLLAGGAIGGIAAAAYETFQWLTQ
jgi:hypothetical protein